MEMGSNMFAIVNIYTRATEWDGLSSETENSGYSAVGRKYGVSDNAVRTWMKGYTIKT